MFATALKRRLRRTTVKLVAGAAVLALAGTTAGTGSATAVPVLASGSSSTPPGMPAVQWDRWPEWNVWDNLLNTSYTNKHTSWNDWTPSTHDSEQAREDRCRVGNVLHQGGPQVRTLARTALAGTDADRRTALGGDSGQDSPIGQAAQRDWAASPPPSGFATAQQQRWLDEINKFDYQFNPPEFDTQIRDFVRGSDHRTYDALDADVVPRAGQAQRDQVVAMVSQLKNTDQYLQAFTTFENQLAAVFGASSPVDITEIANGMSADDARMFLQYGGFAKTTPAPGSAEFRLEVEALKIRWAGCDFKNPADPYRVLEDIVGTAQAEWQAELNGQAAQRNTIVAAEAQAWQNMWDATYAMIESVGQAWVADKLVAYQKNMGPAWIPTPEFTAALKFTQDTIAQQLPIAQNAAASAHHQSSIVDTAQDQAAQIAAAAGLPRGRGLAYALQSAQVTKASAAAADAAVATIQTTVQASHAGAADSDTLFQNACAQMNALQADYRKAAAQEAARQAHAAAQAAAALASEAAQEASNAAAARHRAEQAEQTAQAAAADAHAKRGVAEQERTNAANARARADSERARAQAAEATAQRQQDAATTARRRADDAAAEADAKSKAAVDAENDAVKARDDAVSAEWRRDAAAASAAAAKAKADATDASQDGGAARDAANRAQAEADAATTAAANAHTAANTATDAAIAARQAATEATGAAQRARAAATQADADAATTSAQALAAHSAAADAIAACSKAAADVQAAEQQATTAANAATSARNDVVAARGVADEARVDAGRAAGAAYASSQYAAQASGSATVAVSVAEDAVAAGTPYQEVDASAGLAVLVGQAAKTLAEQQAAVAQVRADEAAAAATAAQQAADRADQDVKEAAQAAAAAAVDAAAAARSLQQAELSAASAATDTAAALRAESNTIRYDQQAHADAQAADAAATAAEGDAAAAQAAATDAERDAAAARQAANDADAEANAARDAAAKAEHDAEVAEQAAANAQAAAQQAESAAKLAEIEADNNATAIALSDQGPAGAAGVLVVPDIKDDATSDHQCVIPIGTDLRYCYLNVDHHITGKLTFLLRTCPDPNQTYCADGYTIDYLGTQQVDMHQPQKVKVPIGPIETALLKSLAYGMVSDFVGCARGKVSDCVWAAATLLALPAIKGGAAAIRGLYTAIRVGRATEEMVTAVETAGLEERAVVGVEKSIATSLIEEEGAAPTIQEVRGQLLELIRRRMLGWDMAKGKFVRSEMETALRIEGERGVTLKRSTGEAEDWIDQYNRTYDAVGNFPSERFDEQWPNLQVQIVRHIEKGVNFVPVDVSQFTPAQIAIVRDFIAQYGGKVFMVGA